MQLLDYLDAGIKKAGSLTALGFKLGLSQPRMSKVKAKVEHLPLDAAIKLADYIGADRIAVISANELATEKKEEKRAFWSHLLAAPQSSYIRHIKNAIRRFPRKGLGLLPHHAACQA